MLERWSKAVDVEPSVAIVTYNEFYIIVVIVFVTDFASHVFQTFIPFFSTDIGWPETQIAFAFF